MPRQLFSSDAKKYGKDTENESERDRINKIYSVLFYVESISVVMDANRSEFIFLNGNIGDEHRTRWQNLFDKIQLWQMQHLDWATEPPDYTAGICAL